MEDIFNGHPSFNYMFWIVPISMAITPIITLGMVEFGMFVSKAQMGLTAICVGSGGGVLIYRFFVIIFNNIKNTKGGTFL